MAIEQVTIPKESLSPNVKPGAEVGQCNGTVTSIEPDQVYAFVFPSIQDCSACLLSDVCPASLDKSD